jgi:hypothetical protein
MCVPLLSKYKWATRMLIVALPLGSFCQNVGIATTSPQSRLHIGAGGDASLSSPSGYLILGNVGLTNMVFDDNEILARNNGAASTLYLNIDGGNIILGSAGEGNVGIATNSPAERLHIASGNIRLDNTPLGINLGGADRPLITRRLDAFTSGNYIGLGRWGLYLEPSRLVLGIPNVVGRAFEFATYELNSTRNTVMQIDRIGGMKRPATGNNDLLPICMGTVDYFGDIVSGTGNFSVETFPADLGKKVITVNGFTFTSNNYIAMVTCQLFGLPKEQFQGYGITHVENGKLVVTTYFRESYAYARPFQFVVYRLGF